MKKKSPHNNTGWEIQTTLESVCRQEFLESMLSVNLYRPGEDNLLFSGLFWQHLQYSPGGDIV